MAEELIEGLRPPVGTPHPVERVVLIPKGQGVFDVHRDGELIFSKKTAGRKPNAGEILALVR